MRHSPDLWDSQAEEKEDNDVGTVTSGPRTTESGGGCDGSDQGGVGAKRHSSSDQKSGQASGGGEVCTSFSAVT